MTIQAIPLSVTHYQPYGNVIQAGTLQDGTAAQAKSANQGTARRFDFLAPLENRRAYGGNGAGAGAALETAPGTLAKSEVSVAIARPNLCVFSCTPQVTADHPNFEIKLLERHPFSTQVFIPMGGPKRYLVIVCLGADSPDLTTLRAFIAHGNQGITYHPGVWHHPMVAMDVPTDFACWVAEDGTAADTQVVAVVPVITVET